VLAEMIELQGVDAVIMGARGLGAAEGLLVGSVSQWLLHHATVPVTVVHRVPSEDD
jgi:nucleotide-binding universal stress UspA family protein